MKNAVIAIKGLGKMTLTNHEPVKVEPMHDLEARDMLKKHKKKFTLIEMQLLALQS